MCVSKILKCSHRSLFHHSWSSIKLSVLLNYVMFQKGQHLTFHIILLNYVYGLKISKVSDLKLIMPGVDRW